MSIPNLPAASDVPELPADVLAELPLDLLGQALTEAVERVKVATERADRMRALIEQRMQAHIDSAFNSKFADKGTEFGSVAINVDGGVFKFDRPKNVRWDQRELARQAESVRAGGGDPNEYFAISYKVEEKRYDAWPAEWRDRVAPARTVKPGKLKITFEPESEAEKARAA